jgi:hypothetical protein
MQRALTYGMLLRSLLLDACMADFASISSSGSPCLAVLRFEDARDRHSA